MIKESNIRTAMLLGESSQELLNSKHITVFGIGGVGGNCIEALARSGIGGLHIVDSDRISKSNLNRQIIATKSNVGELKTDAMKKRIEEISDASVTTQSVFVLKDNVSNVVPQNTDYIIDCIDTITAKIALVQYANANNIPIISCMGMGNRTDSTAIRIGDLYSVNGDGLARTMKRELRKLNINKLTVAYSLETPKAPLPLEISTTRRSIPGSVAFVPSVAGISLAGYVIMSFFE
ncbi:MAG: tRNA threonylcarbamoyladenosine dehydratase [Clostridiales bacterium]|nr:tRNA threonylcarbamoyladenosine dehydratase [Clostridiales bacterium]